MAQGEGPHAEPGRIPELKRWIGQETTKWIDLVRQNTREDTHTDLWRRREKNSLSYLAEYSLSHEKTAQGEVKNYLQRLDVTVSGADTRPGI